MIKYILTTLLFVTGLTAQENLPPLLELVRPDISLVQQASLPLISTYKSTTECEECAPSYPTVALYDDWGSLLFIVTYDGYLADDQNEIPQLPNEGFIIADLKVDAGVPCEKPGSSSYCEGGECNYTLHVGIYAMNETPTVVDVTFNSPWTRNFQTVPKYSASSGGECDSSQVTTMVFDYDWSSNEDPPIRYSLEITAGCDPCPQNPF